jgi:hypothetical protein
MPLIPSRRLKLDRPLRKINPSAARHRKYSIEQRHLSLYRRDLHPGSPVLSFSMLYYLLNSSIYTGLYKGNGFCNKESSDQEKSFGYNGSIDNVRIPSTRSASRAGTTAADQLPFTDCWEYKLGKKETGFRRRTQRFKYSPS